MWKTCISTGTRTRVHNIFMEHTFNLPTNSVMFNVTVEEQLNMHHVICRTCPDRNKYCSYFPTFSLIIRNEINITQSIFNVCKQDKTKMPFP